MRTVFVAAILALGVSSAHAGKGPAISGTVKYSHKPPAPTLIDSSSEVGCAGKKVYTQEIAVDAKGGLAGVLVRVKTGTAGKVAVPKTPVLVKQKECAYEPHVASIMAGQELVIENKDGFLHNVHAKLDGETWFNRSQPKGSPPLHQKDYGAVGQVLELGCDVHPWMKAFVAVTDHPFSAVTGKDGSFSLEGLTAGQTYTIEAWHPTLGLKSQIARVGGTIEFSFP